MLFDQRTPSEMIPPVREVSLSPLSVRETASLSGTIAEGSKLTLNVTFSFSFVKNSVAFFARFSRVRRNQPSRSSKASGKRNTCVRKSKGSLEFRISAYSAPQRLAEAFVRSFTRTNAISSPERRRYSVFTMISVISIFITRISRAAAQHGEPSPNRYSRGRTHFRV